MTGHAFALAMAALEVNGPEGQARDQDRLGERVRLEQERIDWNWVGGVRWA